MEIEEIDLEPVKMEMRKVIFDEEFIEILLEPETIDEVLNWYDERKRECLE